ncbi:MAG: delta-class carbonic anhydrase [Pseudomonadaceae bacterium]|nr:delta-class carbonic anhydrase [Pseudomonadaceae bacterium]
MPSMRTFPLATSVLAAALFVAGCASVSETEPATPATPPVPVAPPLAADVCLDAGPQTPRDISSVTGTNPVTFGIAPSAANMNLCNIHTHTNAEHKGPGYSMFVNATDRGGFACNDTASLTPAELEPAPGAYGGVVPGETIEVHWVHTSCDASPGEGLGACVPAGCDNPTLRVEAQVFLVVNDDNALDFTDFAYAGPPSSGMHQAKALPSGTGDPVQFLGSTTGPSYTSQMCSPAQVTWNVRPMCAKVDINSLHRWAEDGNPFNESKSHGVRQLVRDPRLLSPIGN